MHNAWYIILFFPLKLIPEVSICREKQTLAETPHVCHKGAQNFTYSIKPS